MSLNRRLTGMAGAVAAALPVFLSVPTDGYAQIEEITVTARRREESLQDVPLAVTAFTSQQIQRQGITNLADVANLDPSIQFDTAFGPADTRITVRGLSNTRGRSNVAFLIDGIDVTTENLNAAGSGLLANRRLLNDVERIEVVKGPQSALWGRAAFAGAIGYVTKNPGDEFEGDIGWELGDYGIKQFDFAVGGPLIDGVLGIRAAGVYYESDGFYRNSLSGEPVGDTEGYGYALTTVFTPTDELRFKLRGEYSSEKVGPLPNARLGGGRTGSNMKLYEYPASAIGVAPNDPDRPDLPAWYTEVAPGIPGIGVPALNSTSTGLLSFGQFCPPELQDPSKGPGYCLPSTFGSSRGLVIAQGEDPLTGRDFVGLESTTFRIALETTLDVGVGLFTAYTGWTDFDATDAYDQDWQAEGRPDRIGLPVNSPFLNPLAYGLTVPPGYTVPDVTGFSMQSSRSKVDTNQFSQELRYATNLDGPLQFTAGALYWNETRRLEDSAVIIFCTLTRRAGSTEPGLELSPGYQSMLVDTGNFCSGAGGTLDNYQDFYRQLQPQRPGIWQADTKHWSFYGLTEWEISDRWTAGFETRFISENFSFSKPNQSSCTQFYGPNPGNLQIIGAENDPDQICSVQFSLDPNFPLPNFLPGGTAGTGGYRVNRGDQTSRFNTPKLTLQYQATDDMQLYFSWAKGQKPGGIAATPGGGSPTAFSEDRFDPEKVTSWELGMKSDWRLAGFLRLNGAIFFQDYSDKQIGTQVEQDGFLKPIIINASAAEVWGLEIEALWQPEIIDGLTLSAAWTYLDATFTDYIEETRSLQRSAQFDGPCEIVIKGGTTAFCALDFSGNQLERTPKNSVVAGANLTRPFLQTGLDWFAEFNMTFQSKRFLEAENTVFFEEFYLVDTRLGLQGDRWELLMYIDNLFDDNTIKAGGTGPDFGAQVVELGFSAGLGVSHSFGTLPDPRVFGVRARYRFGSSF